MKIQEKPDYLIFADSAKSGECTNFPDVSRGWGVTIDQTGAKPPMEWMNGAFNRVDKNMRYLLQQGVPEWSEKVTYPANAIIKYNGVLYTAIVENDNAKPSTNTTKWKKTQAEIPAASTEQKGVVQLSSATNSTSETEAATPLAINKVKNIADDAALAASNAQYTADASVKRSGDNMTGELNINGRRVLVAGDALPATKSELSTYEVGEQTVFKKRPKFNECELLTLNDYQNKTGYRRAPDGFLYQWGEVAIPKSTDKAMFRIVYPVAFNENCHYFSAVYAGDACFTVESQRTNSFFAGAVLERVIGDTINAGKLIWCAIGR